MKSTFQRQIAGWWSETKLRGSQWSYQLAVNQP